MAEEWYWCLTHQQVEPPDRCRAEVRMGPYPSPEAAAAWESTRDAREEQWDAEDDRWEGERDAWGRRSD